MSARLRAFYVSCDRTDAGACAVMANKNAASLSLAAFDLYRL
jgi:hypothetical protein